MNPEAITTSIRQRTPWEAVDLGFAMVRAWWISIYTPLAILLSGIIAVLLLVIPYEFYWVSLLTLWWLKPLYHRLILHVISHQVFGQTLNWSETLKALPDLIRHTGLISELSWRRFSLSRGFRLPVWQLERLKGAERRKRQQVLLGMVHSTAIWLNIAIFSFQVILTTSFFMLIWLFVPGYYAEELFYKLVSNQLSGIGYSIEVIAVLGFVIVMVFLEPFYIAASFAMYLNRRTELEAWDIELEFRKIAKRLEGLNSKLTALCLCGLLTLLCAPILSETAYANEKITADSHKNYQEHLSDERRPASDSAKIIQQVMQNEHLIQEENVKRWRLKEDEDDDFEQSDTPPWLKTLAGIFANIIEYALWIAIALAILALYLYRKAWLPLIVRLPDEKQELKPDILFGMDVRESSLPEDIAGAARALWDDGKPRDALSLLYRGALAKLIHHDQLPLEHSHTEGDILKLSRPVLNTIRQAYFKHLTQSWVKVAYAHEDPSETDMEYLLTHWQIDFADNHRTKVGV